MHPAWLSPFVCDRILGDDVEVTDTTLTEPATVETIAAAIAADAVVIDVEAPAPLPCLVAALGAYTLARSASYIRPYVAYHHFLPPDHCTTMDVAAGG